MMNWCRAINNCMKVRLLSCIILVIVCVLFCKFWMTSWADESRTEVSVFDSLAPMATQTKGRILASESGELHSLAVESLVDMARTHQSLAAVDVCELLAFISGPKPDGLTEGEWEERVNVILNVLRAQPGDVPGLSDFLIGTARGHPNRILRFYAMQHLALWYGRESNVAKQMEIVALFVQFAELPESECAGVAILFLNDIKRDSILKNEPSPSIDDVRLGRAAFRLVSDSSLKHDVRISALHTCTARRMREVLPVARQLAADTGAVITLRKAAIYSIGQLGIPEDRELLEYLCQTNPALAGAIKPAIEALKHEDSK